MQRPLVIGTRGSPLALAQAHDVQARLAAHAGASTAEDRDRQFPVRVIATTGDRVRDRRLADIGGKGLFTKELEEALIDGRVDVAVHSMKDVPARMAPGLALSAVLEREDPRDVLVAPGHGGFDALPAGAKIGTSSVRRQAQALNRRPDLSAVLLRGNVGTRLERLRTGHADATFLALAGLKRLGMPEVADEVLEPEVFLPAAAQGAVGVQIRAGDDAVHGRVLALNHADSALAVAIERACLGALDGSCRTPIAAFAQPSGAEVRFRAAAFTPDGVQRWDVAMSASLAGHDEAVALGLEAGARLKTDGGAALAAAIA